MPRRAALGDRVIDVQPAPAERHSERHRLLRQLINRRGLSVRVIHNRLQGGWHVHHGRAREHAAHQTVQRAPRDVVEHRAPDIGVVAGLGVDVAKRLG